MHVVQFSDFPDLLDFSRCVKCIFPDIFPVTFHKLWRDASVSWYKFHKFPPKKCGNLEKILSDINSNERPLFDSIYTIKYLLRKMCSKRVRAPPVWAAGVCYSQVWRVPLAATYYTEMKRCVLFPREETKKIPRSTSLPLCPQIYGTFVFNIYMLKSLMFRYRVVDTVLQTKYPPSRRKYKDPS